MVKLLDGVPIEHLVYFVDDLLLASNDVDKHLDYLAAILSRLQDANLKLTPGKCHFLKKEVKFVGLTLSDKGVRINDERIKALSALQPPTTVKEVQKVLGFFGYNRKFIKGYAEITKPIYDLLNKGRKFYWSEECEESFERLKAAVSKNVILHFPDVEDPLNSYEVTIDGSQMGYGGTLSQIVRGERHIVAYFSKSIPKHKKEWGQTKIEFEAMYQAIIHWAHFLRGCKFTVITDCQSLLSMDKIFAKTNATMHRKLQSLANS